MVSRHRNNRRTFQHHGEAKAVLLSPLQTLTGHVVNKDGMPVFVVDIFTPHLEAQHLRYVCLQFVREKTLVMPPFLSKMKVFLPPPFSIFMQISRKCAFTPSAYFLKPTSSRMASALFFRLSAGGGVYLFPPVPPDTASAICPFFSSPVPAVRPQT